jgi:septum formation protein
MRLVLASASPRRADLLRAAGFAFEIVPADVDESPRDGESPREYVRRLATAKAEATWASVVTRWADRGAESPALQELIVLGADTAVVVDGEVLGKPDDDSDAAAMLRRLSGRRHEVTTGLSVRSSSGERGLVETTSVYMMALSEQDIAWYVASGEGRDKAGAYGIQGLASRFIPRIDGSYPNVIGLPVASFRQLLTELASAG